VTVAERKRFASHDGREYLVRPVRDRETIRGLLETKRPYAAYALGQLDPRLFRLSEWWMAEGEGRRALLLHSRGGLGNATFAMGEAGALEAVLRVHPGSRSAFLTCEVHHIGTVERYFELSQRTTMIRMLVTADTFKPCYEPPVRRLGGRDARSINHLYRGDGVPSFYTPRQVDDSIYFGADHDGSLVAIAGTHVISSAASIAVVGNVYTHPTYRGQHLAQATTSAVTERLLASCREVVLSVDPTNAPAVRAYERLGFREVARLVEGAAVRRDGTGATTAIRRVFARLRGRSVGGEIVHVDDS
jgi:RimJ/RimL family protein N-acetyltransferase